MTARWRKRRTSSCAGNCASHQEHLPCNGCNTCPRAGAIYCALQKAHTSLCHHYTTNTICSRQVALCVLANQCTHSGTAAQLYHSRITMIEDCSGDFDAFLRQTIRRMSSAALHGSLSRGHDGSRVYERHLQMEFYRCSMWYTVSSDKKVLMHTGAHAGRPEATCLPRCSSLLMLAL